MASGWSSMAHPRNASGKFRATGGHSSLVFKHRGGVGKIQGGSTVQFRAVRQSRGRYQLQTRRIGRYVAPKMMKTVRPVKGAPSVIPHSVPKHMRSMTTRRQEHYQKLLNQTRANFAKPHNIPLASAWAVRRRASDVQLAYGRFEKSSVRQARATIARHNTDQKGQARVNQMYRQGKLGNRSVNMMVVR